MVDAEGSAQPLPLQARYVHTNLIAADWQALAHFYENIFGCVRVPPERDLSGPTMEAGTGIPGAHLTGVHLRLPGHGDTGPTLEVFSYDRLADRSPTAVNRLGFAHLAFSVTDVAAARAAVLAAGGRPVGEVVTLDVAGSGRITWCYITDPEGNVIELQAWAKEKELLQGLVFGESLQDAGVLDLLQITRTETWHVTNAAPYQPDTWTALSFEVDAKQADAICQALSRALKPGGWYVNASTASRVYVIFPDRVFVYRQGDREQRAAAQKHALSLGVPESQLDWGE